MPELMLSVVADSAAFIGSPPPPAALRYA